MAADRQSDTHPFLSGEEAETDAQAGAGLAGQLVDFLHFLQHCRWKPWGGKTHIDEGPLAQSNDWDEKVKRAADETEINKMTFKLSFFTHRHSKPLMTETDGAEC